MPTFLSYTNSVILLTKKESSVICRRRN